MGYPKIYNLGHKDVQDILLYDVEITEKVDGSQFSFTTIDDKLHCYSKNTELDINNPTKMFKKAVDYAKSLKMDFTGTKFFCEYVMSEKHNRIRYDKVPKNNLVLFAVLNKGIWTKSYEYLKMYATSIHIDVVPMLRFGKITVKEIQELAEKESFLGGAKMEGVVIKDYAHESFAKYVRPAFREVIQIKKVKSVSSMDNLVKKYATKARYEKAYQHLRDAGELKGDYTDIGKLVVEVSKDIGIECKDEIMKLLWQSYGKTIIKGASKGIVNWYKNKLLENVK